MPQHLVELQPWSDLSERLRSEVRSLVISPQQIEYAGSGDAQIRRVETASGNNLVGLAIVHGDEAVGFLVLKRGSEAPDWAEPEAAVISGMRLGAAHQGKGLGRTALLALPAWLCKHWPACSSITLSVDEDNVAGIKAYAAAGFVDLGQRVQGRIGWVRYMSRPLEGRWSAQRMA
ncbi:GNAT family N-acetyltransferase [Roseateles sp. SL47]|uniref:GNAT family N-acetyltransferase n=1 Tax=Roseateles sp. SL47 TaxID=2995138 RepID=UPI00226E6D31|nr:GNAT family N-acetyltransferase [Roseateles sp. SL47]WAC73852.1 GNAT family N-acetyltransferase [Roseateles sp. SL47]